MSDIADKLDAQCAGWTDGRTVIDASVLRAAASRIRALEAEKRELVGALTKAVAFMDQFFPDELPNWKAEARAALSKAGE